MICLFQVLHDGEGPIHAVKWRNSLIAWANDAGVKVYDMANNSRITFIERPRGSPRPEILLPHLVWQVSLTYIRCIKILFAKHYILHLLNNVS